MSKPHIDPGLAVGLNFDADDLATNRTGKMTGKQKIRLNSSFNGYVVLSIFWILLVGGFCAFLTPNARYFNGQLILALVFFFSVIGFAAWLVFRPMLPLYEDIAQSRSAVISGKVFVTPLRGLSILSIENVNLHLSPTAASRFKSHDYYTVYYAPRSKVVLSAEPYTP